MRTAKYYQHILEFKKPGGTSRGVLQTKETFILEIFQDGKKGVGECGIFRGLSYDDVPEYEEKLKWLCNHIHENDIFLKDELKQFPSIIFGLEQATANVEHTEDIYFPSEFTHGNDSIKINGLIWMGTIDFMQEQIEEKINNGYDCIKLKIGVNWNSEKKIIQKLREKFPKSQLEIRVDANGAFAFEEAKIVLKELAELGIHSIEQPIKAGSWKLEAGSSTMAKLCAETPLPIALDEELIGVIDFEEKSKLLEIIKPQFIILKPSFVGGFSGCDEWISIAEYLGIGWWITSALESNIGLNAIAQYTYTKKNPMPQGLGTGSLFTNNFESRLLLKKDRLYFE